MLNCYVLDDLPASVELLCRYIGRHEQTALAGCETDPVKGMAQLLSRKEQIDVVFLDYEMPGMNGDTIADLLQCDVLVVFVSGHPEFMDRALEHYAVDFIQKPLFYDRFEACVRKLLLLKEKRIPAKPALLKVKSQRKTVFIRQEDIICIELMDHYQKIVTPRETYILNSSGEMLLQILGCDFMQVHKSFIINIDHVTGIGSGVLIMDDGKTTVPIGRSYKEDLLKRLP